METPKNHGNLPQTVVFVPNMIRCYLYIRELTWADSLSSYLSADRTEGFTEESHRRITQKDLRIVKAVNDRIIYKYIQR